MSYINNQTLQYFLEIPIKKLIIFEKINNKELEMMKK
jgi:hypothetical protein